MPKAGDEFDTFWIDDKSSCDVARKVTWRYRANGHTVDPVKIVERQIVARELRFSDDPWQPAQWVYHYGKESVRTL